MKHWAEKIHPDVLDGLALLPQEVQLEILDTVIRPEIPKHRSGGAQPQPTGDLRARKRQ